MPALTPAGTTGASTLSTTGASVGVRLGVALVLAGAVVALGGAVPQPPSTTSATDPTKVDRIMPHILPETRRHANGACTALPIAINLLSGPLIGVIQLEECRLDAQQMGIG